MTNKQRILDISKKLGLSHVGSNLSCLPILEEIYDKKKTSDVVILDNAHAHLAHLVVMEECGESYAGEAKELIEKYGIHCDVRAACDASGGSLGHGLGISIGYALADRTRDVYCIVSDGSMMEGSNWEALRIANDLRLSNIHVYCNFNGYTAVAERDPDKLARNMAYYAEFLVIQYRRTDNGEGFEGVAGHYLKLKNE